MGRRVMIRELLSCSLILEKARADHFISATGTVVSSQTSKLFVCF